mgnify:CR=1 FL=1
MKRNQTIILLIAPAMIWFLIFMVFPLSSMVYTSFLDPNDPTLSTPADPITANYEKFLNPLYAKITLRSFQLAIGTLFVTLIMGYPFAYFATFSKWGKAILLVQFLPFLSPFIIRIFAWRVILGKTGIINYTLMGLGITNEPVTWLLFSNISVLIGQSYLFLPFVTIPIYISLRRIDKNLLEASKDLGAGKIRTFINITLPLSKPGILIGSIITVVPSVAAFLGPTLLGGVEWKQLIADVIFVHFYAGQNKPFGSAVTVFVLSLTIIMAIIGVKSVGVQQLFRGKE